MINPNQDWPIFMLCWYLVNLLVSYDGFKEEGILCSSLIKVTHEVLDKNHGRDGTQVVHTRTFFV